LTVAIFSVGILFSSQYPRQTAQSDSSEKTNQPPNNKSEPKSFWEPLSTDPIAAFTLGLLFVGMAQAGFFYVQLRLIRESLGPAQKAALAAQAAAEYIPVVEGAYVYVVIEKFVSDRMDDLTGIEFTDPPAVEISLKNFGKTPAFIQRVIARLNCVPIKNGDPGRFFVPPETILGAGEKTAYTETIALGDLMMEEAFRVRKHSAHIILEGTLVYADIWGVEWTVPFNGRYDADTRRFSVAHEQRAKTNQNCTEVVQTPPGRGGASGG
jgi:hypothetical protein